MKLCDNCFLYCMCADCVRNANYAINTPKPCVHADCDICDNYDMACLFCNSYLSIKDIDNALEG